jgi:hypothetical protein
VPFGRYYRSDDDEEAEAPDAPPIERPAQLALWADDVR